MKIQGKQCYLCLNTDENALIQIVQIDEPGNWVPVCEHCRDEAIWNFRMYPTGFVISCKDCP